MGGAASAPDEFASFEPSYPVYRHPKKNFRLKQKAVPQWYKSRQGVRSRCSRARRGWRVSAPGPASLQVSH